MKPIEIKVGGAGTYDPAAGGTDCLIPSLAGVDIYIEKVGFGPYPFASYTVLPQGGFRLVGDTFMDDELWYVHPVGLVYGSASSGSYSNGFNTQAVLSAMFGRVGWRQTTTEGEPALNSANQLSASGRYFNDGSFHALVTLTNLKKVQEDAGITDTEFNAWLEVLQRSIIMRSLNAVFGMPEYKSQADVFSRYGYNDSALPNSGKFVGIKIEIPPAIDRAVQIDSVQLYFDTAATIPLYLYADNRQAPIWTANVTSVANTATVVSLPSIVLTRELGSTFYLGYYQNDIGAARAIRESNICWNNGYLYRATGFEAETSGGNFIRSSVPTGHNSYGINAHLSVFVDHSMQALKKASLFDNAIGLGMAIATIEMILFSKRQNGDKRILADGVEQAMGAMVLEGAAPISDGPQISGLKSQLNAEFKRMRESFFPTPKSRVVSLC